MNCPKCNAVMESVTFEEITVDRCTQCLGIWFDEFERERLKEMKGADIIDVGQEAQDSVLNQMKHVRCPNCQAQMIPMVDVKQPHIWYESCPVCYGAFFDAGEFKDYKHESIGDLFKRIGLKGRT